MPVVRHSGGSQFSRALARTRWGLIVTGLLGALVLVGCLGFVGPDRDATAQASKTPAAASPTGDSMDMLVIPSYGVAAGLSRDVPLGFEGTTSARIQLMAASSPITATINGTTVPLIGSSNGISTYALTLANPVDGPVHITNTGTADAIVSFLVSIQTTRHLSVQPPPTPVAKGAPVTIDVVLTNPVAGDAVAVEEVDLSGTSTPLTLVPAGSGHWTAQFSSSVAGSHEFYARTTGSGPARIGSASVMVVSGAVSLGSGFSERLDDTNGDGLAEALVLSPTIAVTAAGSYDVNADLVDGSGALIDRTTGQRTLALGSQALDLTFNGGRIFAAGSAGPYHLANVSIYQNSYVLAARAADLGPTQPYDFRLFQH